SGYKYNEIADKLNVPLGTVKSRIFFARQELQKILKDFRHG
ncbi:sigma factor-like helix-turn-helix DNA-binding protein, partial [Parabacteroides chinchillae]